MQEEEEETGDRSKRPDRTGVREPWSPNTRRKRRRRKRYSRKDGRTGQQEKEKHEDDNTEETPGADKAGKAEEQQARRKDKPRDRKGAQREAEHRGECRAGGMEEQGRRGRAGGGRKE